MSEEVDFNKVVILLNYELDVKYDTQKFDVDIPEFEYKENRHYFSHSKDNYNNPLVTFLKYHVYIGGMYNSDENNENEVINICKEWYNNYLDALVQLKF